MRVALVMEFAASRKVPLAAQLETIHAAFAASHLGEAGLQFCFQDAPIAGFVSSVDRVLKRHPGLARFVSTAAPGVGTEALPGVQPVKLISNMPSSPAEGQVVEFSTLLAVAAGVPRSFPFHDMTLHFRAPAFGGSWPALARPGVVLPGVAVSDTWWVNGRQRFVFATVVVDAAPSGKTLRPPEALAAVLAACGKIRSTRQMVLPDSAPPAAVPDPRPAPAPSPQPAPERQEAITAITRAYRERLADTLERAALPHDLPPPAEARTVITGGEATGPKKPVLVRAFKPLGYECRGESAAFVLRRRTPGNLTVTVDLDVGTWSRSLTAGFNVSGLGFRAFHPLRVSRRDLLGGSYPIGGPENWRKLVDNLAALVAELDRGFVPAIEAASGPSPEWFVPES